MMYTKEYLTGENIDLSNYNLNTIRQIRVDEFMHGYNFDLIDFVRPFYLEQSLDLNEEIRENKAHFTYFYLLSQQDGKIMQELIKSLIFLYELDVEKNEDGTLKNIEEHILTANVNDNLVLILKRNGEPFAFINDSNFNILGKVVLEMCYFEKPKPEKEIKGDKSTVEKIKKHRREYNEKHNKSNTIVFEEMVRQVMHMRRISYNEIKSWTIWQIKDTYTVECLVNASDKSYLLATNSNSSIDLKQVKDWKNETKLTRE